MRLLQDDGKYRWFWKTSLAGEYPGELCHFWASLLCNIASPSSFRTRREPQFLSGWQDEICQVTRSIHSGSFKIQPCPYKLTSAHGKPQSARGARDRAAAAKSRLKKVSDTDPGFLRRARIRKSSTRHTYAEAWKQFIEFCVSVNLLAAPTCKFVSMQQLDRAVEAFGERLFLVGDSKYLLTCALQNCNIEYPQWPTSSRTNYPLSKAAKKGWSNLEPGASRDPCPFEVACWIAMDMLVRGLVYHAAAVMLCFDTYVRPGKCVSSNITTLFLRHVGSTPCTNSGHCC